MAETHEDSPATDEHERATPPRPPPKWKFDEIETVAMETQQRHNQLEATTKATLDIMRVEMNEIKARLNTTEVVQPKLDNIERLLNSLMSELGVRTADGQENLERSKLLKDVAMQTEEHKKPSIMEQFPGPSHAMLYYENRFYEGNILCVYCSPRGDLEIPLGEEWKNLLSKDITNITLRNIFLPLYLGGGIIRMNVSKTNNSNKLSFSVLLISSEENKEMVQLPWSLGMTAYFYQVGASAMLTSAECKVNFEKIGTSYEMFKIPRYVFNHNQAAKLIFVFHS